jgi:regulator of replication initiation timing
MVQHELSMRSEVVELMGECQRLQLLLGELLLKNHELRCEVARLRDGLEAKAPEAKKVQMPPVRFAMSKIIFDWESIG